MGTPIRLSSELLEQARASGQCFHRSVPQQVEHWAHLGKVVEASLAHSSIGRLKTLATRERVEKALKAAEKPAGKKKILKLLSKSAGPLYSADPAGHGYVIQRLPNGTKVRGTFKHRQFIPANSR